MCGHLSNYLFLFMFFTHVQDCRYRHLLVDGLILSPVFVYKTPLGVLPTRLREQTVTFLETTLNCAFKVHNAEKGPEEQCRSSAESAGTHMPPFAQAPPSGSNSQPQKYALYHECPSPRLHG